MPGREKTPLSGSTAMLVLAVLREREMYGYEIIEELERRSEGVFRLKEGTLYPILHTLEKDRCLAVREEKTPAGRLRRYYRVTEKGLRALEEKKTEWSGFSRAVTAVLAGT